MEFPINEYLKRLSLLAPPTVNLDGLTQLHHAQFNAIAFENLDIQLGKYIELSSAHLIEKLLFQKRGGYCFELNGLLLLALRAFGFEARPLLGRVHLHDPPSGRTHQVNLVSLQQQSWIVDAGFGAGGPRLPLKLEHGWSAQNPFWGFRMLQQAPWGWLMQSWEGGWKDSYSFDEGWVTPQDIEVANHFTSTSPKSHFTRIRTASKPLPEGRVSLRNQQLTRIEHSEKQVEHLAPGPQTMQVLLRDFGLELKTPFEAFLPVLDEFP